MDDVAVWEEWGDKNEECDRTAKTLKFKALDSDDRQSEVLSLTNPKE